MVTGLVSQRAYHQLLAATVDYLHQQKARGQRHVVVDPAKLAALTQLEVSKWRPQNPSQTNPRRRRLPAATGPVHRGRSGGVV